jgi:AraC-like DNA-binding protein
MSNSHVLIGDLAEGDRISFWRDVVCTHLYHITTEPWTDPATFRGRWEVRDRGRFGFAEVESVNRRRLRGPAEIARDGYDDIAVQQVVSERVTLSFADNQFDMRAGDLCIFALDWHYEATATDGIKLRTLEIPRAAIGPLLAGGVPRRPRHIPCDTPLGKLLSGGMTDAWAQIPHFGVELGEAVLQNLSGLVAVAYGASADGHDLARTGVRSLRLESAMAFVGRRLADSSLTPAQAAAALGVSVRSLHKMFEPTGESFAQHVTRRRLEACRATLEGPGGANRSIVDVAFGWGFSSLPTFYRAFAAAFGATPGELRETARTRTAK